MLKLLQLLITGFMLGATSVMAWSYYHVNVAGGEVLLVEHNIFLREAEFGFYAFIATLGLIMLVCQIVGIFKKGMKK